MPEAVRRLVKAAALLLPSLVCLLVLEQLPALKSRAPARRDLATFGPPYPAVLSDYLTFTLPVDTIITGPGFGTIQTNSLGYRGRFPREQEKLPGVRRLLFLGDSFTLGWGLREEETIPARIQHWLDGRASPWEVINAGYHAGCSPDAYYAYLKREGRALAPDVVVVILYTGNDIEDLRDNVWTSVDGSGAPLALYTIRVYTDYQGRLMNPSLLPWYYELPLLNESRIFLNVAGAATRVVNGIGVPGSGRLGAPLTEDEAWRRFALVGRAMAEAGNAQYIPLRYVAVGRPGVAKSRDPVLERVRTIIQDELHLPLLVLHDVLKETHTIPGDGHLNASGASLAASRIQDDLDEVVARVESSSPQELASTPLDRRTGLTQHPVGHRQCRPGELGWAPGTAPE